MGGRQFWPPPPSGLSAEFDLPKPAWVDKPQYFLNSPCPREDVGLDMSEFHQERLRRSPEASGLLSAETLNSYTESTCDFEKVVVRKVERKFESTSLRHIVFRL